ncbi:MAG: homoserine kinase [Clostridia bacterium]|nr:homoserine kinase [Clostridia bacterium]
MVKLRVPASTANLGPGFDSFGCALSLYNEYTFEKCDHLEITGCPVEYCNERNLTVVAIKKTLQAMDQPWEGLKMEVDAHIPVSSGLGSSAAMIVAGAKGANALYGNPLSDQQLFELCTEMEGHPDNIAPAFFGGMTVSVMEQGKPLTVRFPVHPELRFLVLIPDFSLSTKMARSVLPQTISRADAIFNESHAGLLTIALERGDEALIRAAMQDRLHQPYRRSLIKDIDAVEKAAMEAGAISFCISGAGPTCLCLTKDPTLAGRLQDHLSTPNSRWKVLDLQIAE